MLLQLLLKRWDRDILNRLTAFDRYWTSSEQVCKIARDIGILLTSENQVPDAEWRA